MKGVGCMLLLLVLVGAQGSPSIIQRDGQVLVVMNSASLTLRMLENKEKFSSATFDTAVLKTTGTDSISAALTFGQAKASEGLSVSKFVLTFGFEKIGDYWEMRGANASISGMEGGKQFDFANAQLISEIGLYAPDTMSFHCSRFGPLYPAEVGGNHTFALDLLGFQIQPFSNNTARFSEAYECVGFFSIGILSGIFVTIILLAILTWGLAMIMDVKTMDRFDDPKGKPISFAGNE